MGYTGVRTETKDHSLEGHTKTATLWFKNKKLWEYGCHPNTYELGNALHELEDRFTITMVEKEHLKEGHTGKIFVQSNGTTLLNGLSTHASMDEVATIVNAILAVRDYIP
ncbi:hypothetical protein N7490_008365 [Penicillium lividum]|nr:hypothetical protein N7490_008365 [Penicillium lividum]